MQKHHVCLLTGKAAPPAELLKARRGWQVTASPIGTIDLYCESISSSEIWGCPGDMGTPVVSSGVFLPGLAESSMYPKPVKCAPDISSIMSICPCSERLCVPFPGKLRHSWMERMRGQAVAEPTWACQCQQGRTLPKDRQTAQGTDRPITPSY